MNNGFFHNSELPGAIEKSAQFSSNRKYRYSLKRIWDRKRGCVLFVCLNPSTADENKDDPTIRRCINFSKVWGYGGMVMINLFAFRATNPKDMMACADPVGVINPAYWQAEHKKASITIAAWGDHGSFMDMEKKFLETIKGSIYCLSLTKSGHPGHPLYLKKTFRPALWIKEI